MMLRARMQALLSQHGQELSPWLLVAAAGAVILVVLLLALLLRRRNDPSTSSPAPAQTTKTALAATPAAASSGEQRALDREIHNLIKELSDLTRRVNAQIAQVDERSARLEQLIRAADERAARLRGMPGSSDGDEIITSPAPEDGTMRLSATTSLSPASDDGADPRYVEIYTLADGGLTAQQIADRLHRPSGEVELIIALRPRRHAVGSSRD